MIDETGEVPNKNFEEEEKMNPNTDENTVPGFSAMAQPGKGRFEIMN